MLVSYNPKEHLRKAYQEGLKLLKKTKGQPFAPIELEGLRVFNLEIENHIEKCKINVGLDDSRQECNDYIDPLQSTKNQRSFRK
ncbi:MAG: hypothetical protein OXE55_04830 [Flavobacteriaceae bacterium]|nr:hypothetical protein [Flavobacteriaceae bacterium]